MRRVATCKQQSKIVSRLHFQSKFCVPYTTMQQCICVPFALPSDAFAVTERAQLGKINAFMYVVLSRRTKQQIGDYAGVTNDDHTRARRVDLTNAKTKRLQSCKRQFFPRSAWNKARDGGAEKELTAVVEVDAFVADERDRGASTFRRESELFQPKATSTHSIVRPCATKGSIVFRRATRPPILSTPASPEARKLLTAIEQSEVFRLVGDGCHGT